MIRATEQGNLKMNMQQAIEMLSVEFPAMQFVERVGKLTALENGKIVVMQTGNRTCRREHLLQGLTILICIRFT